MTDRRIPPTFAPTLRVDPTAEAAYLTVAEGEHAETRELVPGVLFADFDRDGRLLGVEVMGGGRA